MATTEAAEAVEPVLDAASDAILEGVDGVVESIEVVRNNPVAIVAAGVVGVALGGAVGYFVAVKRLGKQFDAQLAEEIETTKRFYSRLNKVGEDGRSLEPKDLLESGEVAADAVRVYRGQQAVVSTLEEDEQDEAQIRKIEKARLESISVDEKPGPFGGTVETVKADESRNVFLDPTFDYAEEVKLRTKIRPYIITHDEYFEAEKDYETQSLVYYAQDDTLADERDDPLTEIDKIVGDENLGRFGHGSNDPSVVYIRNDRLEIDYEITKSDGSFLKEVLGMDESPPDATGRR